MGTFSMATFSRIRVLRSLLTTIHKSPIKRLISQQEHIEKIFPPNLKRRPGYVTKEGWLMLLIPGASLLANFYFEIKIKTTEESVVDLSVRSVDDPIPLPLDDPEEANDLEYFKSVVKGKFDHAKEMYLKMRKKKSPLDVIPEGYRKFYNPYGYTEPEPTGYHVITPFILDSGERILVDRGWVDEEHLDPNKRLSGQVSESLQIAGLIRKSENVPLYSRIKGEKGKVDEKMWIRRDVESMANDLDCLPILIELCKESYIEGGPITGQTLLDNVIPLDKLNSGYWVTFTITCTLFFIWFQKYIKIIKLRQM